MKLFFRAALLLTISLKVYAECPKEFDIEVRKLHSKENVNFCDLYQAGKAMLIVNTASHCGFTKQFGGLEALHKKYGDKGLMVVGVPSDDFFQEEKTEEGTARVCYQNFGVSFVMTEHAKVKGKKANSVFTYLTEKTEAASWNFNKYLIDAKGNVSHFGSKMTPTDSALEAAVIEALQEN